MSEVADHVVLDILVNAMQKIGSFKGLAGHQKKELVIQTIQYEMELPDELERLIIALIDILIQVEYGELVFKKKIKKTLRYTCCLW